MKAAIAKAEEAAAAAQKKMEDMEAEAARAMKAAQDAEARAMAAQKRAEEKEREAEQGFGAMKDEVAKLQEEIGSQAMQLRAAEMRAKTMEGQWVQEAAKRRDLHNQLQAIRSPSHGHQIGIAWPSRRHRPAGHGRLSARRVPRAPPVQSGRRLRCLHGHAEGRADCHREARGPRRQGGRQDVRVHARVRPRREAGHQMVITPSSDAHRSSSHHHRTVLTLQSCVIRRTCSASPSR